MTGETLVVTAGSQRDPGLSTVTVPLIDLGISGQVATGGPGHDLLVSSPANAFLTGGAGADIFAVRMQEGPVQITDFQPGIDRLDLSDWPMLRDAAQLEVTTTPQGAVVSYRDFSVIVGSDSGAGLTAPRSFPRFAGARPDAFFFESSDISGDGTVVDDTPLPPEEPGPDPPAR